MGGFLYENSRVSLPFSRTMLILLLGKNLFISATAAAVGKVHFFVFFSIHVLRILSEIFALYGAPFQSNKTSSQKIYDFIFSESHIWQLKQG